MAIAPLVFSRTLCGRAAAGARRSGGFGKVFLGEYAGQRVAIKTVPCQPPMLDGLAAGVDPRRAAEQARAERMAQVRAGRWCPSPSTPTTATATATQPLQHAS